MIPNVIIDAVLVLLQEKIFCSLAPFEFLLDILGDMIWQVENCVAVNQHEGHFNVNF